VGLLIALLTLVLVGAVVVVVSAPLRAARAGAPEPEAYLSGGDRAAGPLQLEQLEQLEAAREAKYRELRDLELDFRTGKLSHADYEATDAQLRAEAIAILDRLDRVKAGGDALRTRGA